MSLPRMVVLISGTGRNLQAIIDAIASERLQARIVHVFSNRQQAAGLSRAWAAGLPTTVIKPADYADREAFDADLARRIDRLEADWVVLAGYMRILSSDFVKHFAGRLVNIHPSLLPRYKGLDTHQRVVQAGEKTHGATVHFVTDDLDGGPAILQGRIPVLPDDDADRLAQRLMDTVETDIYPQALAWLAEGRLRCQGNRVYLDGRILSTPVQKEFDYHEG